MAPKASNKKSTTESNAVEPTSPTVSESKRVTKTAKDVKDKVVEEVSNLKDNIVKSTKSKSKKAVPADNDNSKDKVDIEEKNTVDTTPISEETSSPKKPAKKRVFNVLRVLRNGKEQDLKTGKFQHKTPAGAARKAANYACKTLYADEDNCCVDIWIHEVLKTDTGKDYGYRAERSLNTKTVPFKGTNGEVNIPFKYTMKLTSLKKTQTGDVVPDKDVTAELETVNDASTLM